MINTEDLKTGTLTGPAANNRILEMVKSSEIDGVVYSFSDNEHYLIKRFYQFLPSGNGTHIFNMQLDESNFDKLQDAKELTIVAKYCGDLFTATLSPEMITASDDEFCQVIIVGTTSAVTIYPN